jgi:hypothetical protein
MDPDFRPVKRPAKSLRATLEARSTSTPTPIANSFRTPEEVAALDAAGEPATPVEPVPSKLAEISRGWRDKLHLSWPPGKREWLASLIIIVVCGSLVAIILNKIESKPVVSATRTVKPVKKVAPKPTTVPSTLTGIAVDPSLNQRPVTAVMIENSLDARPQSGLSEAGVVFEAIAEGGITRFMALYQDTAPADIGPIRSARPYYIEWALGFDAGYAHVGGSPEALADIKAWSVRDLDQFYNGGSYHRISSRAAPHNVYTAVDTLVQLQQGKGWPTSTYTGFTRKKADPAKQVTARTIDLKMSGPLYNVHYDYNPTTNSYNRSEGGAAHVDVNGSRQISPAVVVAMVVPYGFKSDGYHSDYQVVGSGPVYIFQDGVVSTGTWTKPDDRTQISFTDAAGKPLGLNPGQTWVTAVSAAGNVTSAP